MGDVLNTSIGAANLTGILSETFSPIMGILKAVGIVFIIYLIFLIIKAATSINSARNIKKIAQAVDEINSKLDKKKKK